MFHKLPIPFAHVSSINHDVMHLPKVIHDKNLPWRCQPSGKKKSHFQRNLSPPNTLPEERNIIFTNKVPVKGSSIKLPFVRRGPSKLVFPFSSHCKGIQQSVEGNQKIHLPIVSRANKANIPLKVTTRKVQVSCNKRNLLTSNAK
jgi:hypothetical protein